MTSTRQNLPTQYIVVQVATQPQFLTRIAQTPLYRVDCKNMQEYIKTQIYTKKVFNISFRVFLSKSNILSYIRVFV